MSDVSLVCSCGQIGVKGGDHRKNEVNAAEVSVHVSFCVSIKHEEDAQ